MTILVITTGGTIGAMPYKDVKHPPKVSTMPGKGQDFVRTGLQKITNFKTRCLPLEARDSKDIDDAYRQMLLDTLKAAPESAIMITHGTDALIKTADFFYKKLPVDPVLQKKTIIMTGAMVPLSCGAESDGMSNMSFALRQLSGGMMHPGIYIVLSDYQDEATKTGWAPRLHFYKPNSYEKIYDAEDARRSRLRRVN
ncbi:MAG TPA: asparaginase domain-containing protein [Alphaproteobacteria bacterium]|nr:asparaginase domain-containing protein [Alphaproteobacteria bacterium]